MSTKKITLKRVVAVPLKKGHKYIGIMSDGSEQHIRTSTTRLYATAHLHSTKVNTGKKAGLPSTVSFGKDPSDPDTCVETFTIEQLPEAPAPKAKAKAKAKAEKRATITSKTRPAAPGTYKALEAEHKGKSTIDHPVAVAWDIYSKHPDATRKHAVTMAMEAGVGYHTARTQYQYWRTAMLSS